MRLTIQPRYRNFTWRPRQGRGILKISGCEGRPPRRLPRWLRDLPFILPTEEQVQYERERAAVINPIVQPGAALMAVGPYIGLEKEVGTLGVVMQREMVWSVDHVGLTAGHVLKEAAGFLDVCLPNSELHVRLDVADEVNGKGPATKWSEEVELLVISNDVLHHFQHQYHNLNPHAYDIDRSHASPIKFGDFRS